MIVGGVIIENEVVFNFEYIDDVTVLIKSVLQRILLNVDVIKEQINLAMNVLKSNLIRVCR